MRGRLTYVGLDWVRRAGSKLRWLREVDRARVEFGAARHGYVLRPIVGEAELTGLELRNGYRFPAELREYWSHLGGGGAGPHYGMLAPSEVVELRPTEAFTPIEDLVRSGRIWEAAVTRLREVGTEIPSRDWLEEEVAATYGSARLDCLEQYMQARGQDLPMPAVEFSDENVEICRDDITGLIAIIEEGCGHRVCLLAQGKNTGWVYFLSNDGYLGRGDSSFAAYYEQWLDRLIGTYRALVERTSGGTDFEPLLEERTSVTVEAGVQIHRPSLWLDSEAVRRIASIRGIVRPRLNTGQAIEDWNAEQARAMAAMSPIELPQLT